MKKTLLLAGLAVITLGAGPALAQGAAVGGAAGGAAGAVVGGAIFGPIGAAIGGFTGAAIGADAGVDDKTIEYVRVHPTEPVVIQGDIAAGYVVPDTVTIHAIDTNPDLGYFYTNDRVWIVNMADRKVVYSPGVVVAAK